MSRTFAMISTVWLSMFALLLMALPADAAAPTISYFSPVSGKVGDRATITGTNFTGASAVMFNGTKADTYSVISATSITANVPNGAATGKISVTTPDSTATSTDNFTVWIPSALDITVDPGLGYMGALSKISLSYSLMGTETYTGSVSFDNAGKASIGSIRPGLYNMTLYGSHWLRRSIKDIDLSGSKSIVVQLANGDSDKDNQVNLFDFVVLDANFGTALDTADLDGSGQVNLFDYVVIDNFFAAIGDADGKTKINPVDGAVMVWVSAGEFLRGSPVGYSNEKPQRSIYLNGYWMYKYEVTVAQYRAFCLANGRSMPDAPSWGWQDTHPMVNLKWQEAVDYAGWAGGALPTEAQWEKAAKGPDGLSFPWGNAWDSSKCVCNENSPTSTKPVGSFPAGVSGYGCMDMSGNAWEWCADWYDGSYYPIAPANNPPGSASGSYRVVRGGSWYNNPVDAYRTACRSYTVPTGVNTMYGFRCAKTD